MFLKQKLTSSHDGEWNQGLKVPKVASPNAFKINKTKKIISLKNGLHQKIVIWREIWDGTPTLVYVSITMRWSIIPKIAQNQNKEKVCTRSFIFNCNLGSCWTCKTSFDRTQITHWNIHFVNGVWHLTSW